MRSGSTELQALRRPMGLLSSVSAQSGRRCLRAWRREPPNNNRRCRTETMGWRTARSLLASSGGFAGAEVAGPKKAQ